ncbi:unnamed protein product [Effrenium voratum]|nr:unnamed protein product [Effrenium voratum]
MQPTCGRECLPAEEEKREPCPAKAFKSGQVSPRTEARYRSTAVTTPLSPPNMTDSPEAAKFKQWWRWEMGLTETDDTMEPAHESLEESLLGSLAPVPGPAAIPIPPEVREMLDEERLFGDAFNFLDLCWHWYWAQGGTVSWAQFSTSFMWPPAQVADFGLGVLAAELGKGEHDFRLWKALIADLAFAASAAAVMLLPVPGTHAECQEDHNALLSHGCSLAIAVFIYGSQHGSCVAHLLSHPALVALGKYSFEVYLFQWPLQAVLRQLLGQWPFEPDVFMGFLLLLWLLAGLYVEYVAPTTCIRALE